MNVSSILNWFKRAMPTPTDKNRRVQVGVHFEEVAEMLRAMGFTGTAHSLDLIANALKTGNQELREIDRLETLDALCDQIVTALGTGYTLGFDMLGALAEVDRSNWSKFVDGQPVFDANGKIAKPPTYSKPDLTPFV